MTRAWYPVAGCDESRTSGSEREGTEAIPSSTPNTYLSLVSTNRRNKALCAGTKVTVASVSCNT